MNKKGILTYTIALLSAIGIVGVLFVLVSALGPSARERLNVVTVNLSSIVPGQVKLVETNLPVYIVSPTDEILSDLDIMSDHVWDRKISTIYRTSHGDGYFIFYKVQNENPSCLPKIYKKDEPNNYRTDGATWLGGFWDQCRDISYDYAGRAIKDIPYAYINFSKKTPSLPAVTNVSDDGEHLFIYDEKR